MSPFALFCHQITQKKKDKEKIKKKKNTEKKEQKYGTIFITVVILGIMMASFFMVVGMSLRNGGNRGNPSNQYFITLRSK